MSSSTAEADQQTDDPTEFPSVNGPGWAQIVQALEAGDRVHVQFPSLEGDVQWASFWVDDAGDDYAEFDRYRVELTDDEEYQRFTFGEGGVRLLEQLGDDGEWVDEDWTKSLNSIERVPAAQFEDECWYQWEIHVSETPMGGTSTDQAVFPEAPSRAIAEAKAKRWAELSDGYTPVVYREDPVTVPERDGGESSVDH